MTAPLSRAFDGIDLEVRSEGEGRTVAGIVVPFGRTAMVSDGGPRYLEMFEKGSFAKTIRERGDRVKLLSQHDARRNPLGRAVALKEDERGLYGEFRVSKTAAGDEALELLRDGALDSFSVGFAPINHVKRGKVTVRTEVALREASLVTFPAYEDARIEAVRAWDALSEDEQAELLAMYASARDLSATPGQEPADSDTAPAVVAAEEPREHSGRQKHHAKFNFAAAVAERGIR